MRHLAMPSFSCGFERKRRFREPTRADVSCISWREASTPPRWLVAARQRSIRNALPDRSISSHLEPPRAPREPRRRVPNCLHVKSNGRASRWRMTKGISTRGCGPSDPARRSSSTCDRPAGTRASKRFFVPSHQTGARRQNRCVPRVLRYRPEEFPIRIRDTLLPSVLACAHSAGIPFGR